MADWIRCADRMPDLDVLVVTYDDAGEFDLQRRRRHDDVPSAHFWESQTCGDWYGQDAAVVTHWLPLPEEPKCPEELKS